jgi:HPr kinase/phosphorylase
MANTNSQEATLHASAVLVGGHGVLIRGKSGSGKSSIALALLFGGPDDATLVADDRVILSAESGRLVASVPEPLAGLLEVRGVGIVRLPHRAEGAIDLVADLVPLAACPRLPDAGEAAVELAGIRVARVFVALGAPDGALRIRAALAGFGR